MLPDPTRNVGQMVAIIIAAALVGWSTFVAPARAANDALWSALREGRAFAMIRHALAPGYGDPDDFKFGDCATQRNLSQKGRDQAKRIGELFRRNGVVTADVYTSQWCRCRETAELIKLGVVRDLPSLNSFFQESARRQPQTAALESWLRERSAGTPLILVTHQVNISALTGRGVGSGEIVVVGFSSGQATNVIGTIPTL